MAEKEKIQMPGFRNAAVLFGDLAELLEKHQEVDRPVVSLNGYGDDEVRFFVWASASSVDELGLTYEERKRRSIEQRMDLLMAFFNGIDGPLQWTENEPTEDPNYYKVWTIYRGAKITISAQRTDVGEKVKVVNAGPQFTEGADGQIRALTQQATIWTPSIRLKALVKPGFELGAAPEFKELTA